MGEPITFTLAKFANNYLKYKLHVIQVYYEIPLTCAQYAILNERERGRFSRSVHESLLHVWLSFCMYVAYKRWELLHKGGSETFSFGTHHSLFTCEISYVHTCIRHPPPRPATGLHNHRIKNYKLPSGSSHLWNSSFYVWYSTKNNLYLF